MKIIKKITIVPDTPGRYLSFPTAAVGKKGEVLIVYRDASVEDDPLPPDYAEHGIKGDMVLMAFNVKGQEVLFSKKIYDHRLAQ